jgi:hypothetical protein
LQSPTGRRTQSALRAAFNLNGKRFSLNGQRGIRPCLTTHAPQKPRKYVRASRFGRHSTIGTSIAVPLNGGAIHPPIAEVLPMTSHLWQTLQITKQEAAARLRQLWAGLAMLMGSFPDLRDAFNPDELPLEFILKRDSQTDPSATRLRPMPERVCGTSRAALVHAIDRRSGPTKRIPDERVLRPGSRAVAVPNLDD